MAEKKKWTLARLIATAVAVVIVLFIGLVILASGGRPIFQAIFTLFIGWFPFLFSTLPQVDFDLPNFIFAIGWIGLTIVMLHWFARWLYANWQRQENDESQKPRWHWRWSFTVVAITIFLFVTGIAAIGVVHQTGWLITSPKPLIESSWDDMHKSRPGSVARSFCYPYWDYLNGKLSATEVIGRMTFGLKSLDVIDYATIKNAEGKIIAAAAYPKDPRYREQFGYHFCALDADDDIYDQIHASSFQEAAAKLKDQLKKDSKPQKQ